MNLFDLAMIGRQKGVYTVRQERIKREGSCYYTWVVPAIAAAASSVINVGQQFPDARKYEPLDWLQIINNEAANDLTLTINNRQSFLIPAGTIWTFDNLALWHIKVTNDGGTTTTLNKIVITLQKQPLTIDKWARRQ